MEVRRIKLSQELKEAREALLDINFATLAPNLVGRESSSYRAVSVWLNNWEPTFRRFYAFSRGTSIGGAIQEQMIGSEEVTDIEVFNELRSDIISIIDFGLHKLDQEYQVKPLLEDYIKRVKDTKLAVLLNEFNATKDIAPNLVAIGFRTILSLVIQEKAKRVNPTSNTATCTDLSPREMIDRARNDQILSPDEQRLVNSFASTHRDIYDIVAHRPNVLIDKSEVDIMVDLLNKLLPSIIN